MGTTSPDNLPYPGLGDTPDGPAQLAALASATQTALTARTTAINALNTPADTSWATPADSAGWDNGNIAYRRYRGIVYLRLNCQRSSSDLGTGTESTIFTLPSGFRIVSDTFMYARYSGSADGTPVEVNADGTVRVPTRTFSILTGNTLSGYIAFIPA